MATYPDFGTTPIKCAKRGCKWVGYETELAKRPTKIVGVSATTSVCPICGHDSYQFLTDRQIKIWKKQKAA